jgi:hypothetical protein
MIPVEENKLVILWLSADKRAAMEMALSYARDSLLTRRWNAVTLLLWGPPVEAAAADEALRNELRLCRSVGVAVAACADCAALYGVTDALRADGIDVRGLGQELTDLLQKNRPLLLI